MSGGTDAAGRLSVSGGAGGTAVATDELAAACARLLAVADEVLGQETRLAVGLGPGPWYAALVALVRHAGGTGLLPLPGPEVLARVVAAVGRVEADCAQAAGVAALEAGRLVALASSVRGALAAYRAGERVVAGLVAGAQDATMAATGLVLPPLAVATALVAATAALDPDVRADLEALVFTHPWLVDVVAGGADGLLGGAAAHPVIGPLLAWACLVEGRPFPPRSQVEAVGALESLAHLAGALDEAGRSPRVEPVPSPVDAPAPTSLASLLAGQVDLGGRGATVRVIEVPQPGGGSAWVVEIPGTQRWWPAAGTNPFDATTDVAAMAGEATVAARGVTAALDAAMAASGRRARTEPVLLSGHSQGGILAAALASDPRFLAGHRVTHVVTAGAPVAAFPVPASVDVLSLEHDQDLVPRLDGRANPDVRHWTTVTRDLAGDPEAAGHPVVGHGADEYAETAALLDRLPAGASVSLDAWRRGAAPFLLGDGSGAVVVRDFRLARGPDPGPTGGWQNAPP